MGLSIEKVSKKFTMINGRIDVLDEVSLNIEKGEFICIVGPSGCGKTTLLNIVAGLEIATEGKVLLNEKEINEPFAGINIIFQELALFPWLRVIDNIEFGMRMAGVGKEERRNKAEKYLQMVHLSDFRNSLIHELSGGMKQRVAIARALTLDSEVLLMDEPFTALDDQIREDLQLELQTVWMKTGQTIILVTHNIQEAVFLAGRVVVMTGLPGRIKCIVDIDWERPRHHNDSHFSLYKANMIKELQEEMRTIAAME